MSTFQFTLEQLQSICKGGHSATLSNLLISMNEALVKAEADSPLRAAMWIAQWGHESLDFRFMHEIWGPTPTQLQYELPYKKAVQLGNIQKGDGFLFRGRGFCQLTGRDNYKHTGDALGIDLISNPDLAASPDIACKVAAHFWTTRNLNKFADEKDMVGSTLLINGGHNGIVDRIDRYKLACQVLGC